MEGGLDLRRYSEGRLIGLRINRYSWWTHWREIADYLLPRRYRWLITPNLMSRGSPINQHILDSTGTLAARNLASGMISNSSPTRPWFKLKVGRIDTTQTTPVSLWLAEVERLLLLIFQESNFYTSLAVAYYDLVVFGTAAMLIYEDYDSVVRCYNPCLGEYYVDNDGAFRPVIFYREFTLTISQEVNLFGIENVGESSKQIHEQTDGANKAREIIIAHGIEPNTNPSLTGVPGHFPFYEVYWEWGGSTSPQGQPQTSKVLRKGGFHERPNIVVRWDLVSNDAYGRSPGMDALPDVKQLQLEVKRKAQGIDKHVNPPMVADIQLKNQPASLLPGGVTYIAGMTQGKTGFAPAYGNWKPELAAMTEDLQEIRDRIRKTFFNDLFQTATQFETRSNITALEWDMRKSESLTMLGPVLTRVHEELLDAAIDRVFGIAARAGIFPDPPPEIAGRPIDIEYVSVLSLAQAAAASSGIERTFAIAGNLAAADPAALDNIDIDFGLDKFSSLMNNDPRLIRSPAQLAMIRQQRQQQQAAQRQAELVEKMAGGAKTLSETQVGGGQDALQQMLGAPV